MASSVPVYGIWPVTGNTSAYTEGTSTDPNIATSSYSALDIQASSGLMNSCSLIGFYVASHSCYNTGGYNRLDLAKYTSSWEYVYEFLDVALQDFSYDVPSGRVAITCNLPIQAMTHPNSYIAFNMFIPSVDAFGSTPNPPPSPDVFVLSTNPSCASFSAGSLPTP